MRSGPDIISTMRYVGLWKADQGMILMHRSSFGMGRKILLVGFVLLAASAAQVAANTILNGAGATFPAPLYAKWFQIYEQKTDTRITYQKVGSGEGLRQILSRAVDFGASDAFMSDAELARQGAALIHIPTCLGAVAVTYNLPENPTLRLTPEVLADIYLGRITNWADCRIAAENPGLRLRKQNIAVVSRLDGSGTTFIFTDYLSKVSTAWRETVGCGKKVQWPVGMRVARNEGVAEMVAGVPGSIGYVSLNYAVGQRLPVAALRNRSGFFIQPTLTAVSAAGDVWLQTDARMMITDTPAPGGYPISAFTYLLLYREQSYDQRSHEKAEGLANMLHWIIDEGQRYAPELHYAPLPMRVIRNSQELPANDHLRGRPLQ